MKRFVDLFQKIDATTSTNAKVEFLANYLTNAEPADAAWATYFLTGNRIKRFITSKNLQTWAKELTAMPDWLFAESYNAVGDTAETVALLVAQGESTLNELPLHQWLEQHILPMRNLSKEQQGAEIKNWWQQMNAAECFVLNKLLTGAFRVGVAKTLVFKALSQITSLPQAVLAHRFVGNWQPSADFYLAAINPEGKKSDSAKPYPFYLAYPLEADDDSTPDTLAADYLTQRLNRPEDWFAEWKWDGIRGQILHHASGVYLWSRGEEVISEQFPELISAGAELPMGTVLDGEILCWRDGLPEEFSVLQTRLGRKKPSTTFIAKHPAIFMAYDLLELNHNDIRSLPLMQRKSHLAQVINTLPLNSKFTMSPEIDFGDFEHLEQLRGDARNFGVEGLMLKRRQSAYQAGRKKGDWWKYKVDPYTVDAVLLYAQPGSGRRASLYTDYTFAVWQGEELVPVAKAYSGLTDREINQVDDWIRKHTVERFGPVRSVQPELVFELAFENIARSTRHKSNVALRFPRIKRWRHDKTAAEAEQLDMLLHLLDEKAQRKTRVYLPEETRLRVVNR